jgi:hypothetical protein
MRKIKRSNRRSDAEHEKCIHSWSYNGRDRKEAVENLKRLLAARRDVTK